MTLPPEDPRLSAYVLGELGTEDAAAVARAAGEDPALQAEIAEIQALQHFLTDRLALPADKLHPHQRENIRRSARDADRPRTITSINALRPWFIPIATAAVITLAAFILIQPPAETPQPIAVETPAPAIIAPITAPPIIAPPPADLPPAVPQGSVAAADSPTLALPILTAKSDLESLAKFIRFDQQLPPPAAVRLEGILNNFPLRLNGVAAISRSAANTWHPDNRGSVMSAHVATLTTEMIACPWKPSATLLFISLRGNARSACDVRISYHANPGSVARYRLLGFNADGPTAPTLPAELPANSTIILAIEIESSQPGGDLGTLEWFTEDQPAPTISLVHKRDAEPSDDARFAALVCTYAQWLTGEQAGVIQPEIVSALAREIASANLPADRAEFLKLIDESLDLSRP